MTTSTLPLSWRLFHVRHGQPSCTYSKSDPPSPGATPSPWDQNPPGHYCSLLSLSMSAQMLGHTHAQQRGKHRLDRRIPCLHRGSNQSEHAFNKSHYPTVVCMWTVRIHEQITSTFSLDSPHLHQVTTLGIHNKYHRTRYILFKSIP